MNREQYWNPLVPELTVSDVETSLSFYAAVGFTVRFRRTEPEFVYIKLGDAQLMLEQEHASDWNVAPLDRPFGRGINFQIEVPIAFDVAERLNQAGYCLYREPKESWYSVSESQEEGQIELLAQDPDGYLMRIVQILESREATPNLAFERDAPKAARPSTLR